MALTNKNTHIILIIIILFFTSTNLISLPAKDSISVNKAKKQIEIFLKKAVSGTNHQKIREYFHKAVNISKENNLQHFLCIEILKKGNQLRNKGQFILELHFYKKGLRIAKANKDTLHLIKFYNNIGVSYRKIDDYKNSLYYHQKALDLSEIIKDTADMAVAINSMGNDYLLLKDYSMAVKYFKKSLDLEQGRKNMIGVAINLNNLGFIYKEQKNFNRAINYFNLSLEINKQLNSKIGIAICSNDLSDTYLEKGDYSNSLAYALNALKISKSVNNKPEVAYSYIKLGEIYNKLGNYKQAMLALQEGIRLSKELSSKANLKTAYLTLSEIYKAKHNYKEALKYSNIERLYEDSIVSNQLKKYEAKLQIQFETIQKQQEINFLNQKAVIAKQSLNEKQKWIYILSSSFLLLIVILVVLVILIINNRKKTKQLILKNKQIEKSKFELELNKEHLLKAREQAEESARTKSSFLANMSHEIRTPLNAVLGFSDLLNNQIKDPKQKSYLQAIQTSGQSLMNLINDILDFSKYENENLPREKEKINIAEVTKEVINIFSFKASDKGIILNYKLEENLPCCILFNKMMLQQILLNLVGNAIKFTKKGIVSINISHEPGKSENKVNLKIEVRDTGIGISPEDKKHLFKPFHQGKNHKATEGSGLGLSITKKLVERLNGTIEIESEENKGSNFILTFMDVTVAEIKKTDSSGFESYSLKINHSPILLSQKNEISLKLKQLFKKYGYQIKDVGMSLAKARKFFDTSFVIILCCLTNEEIENSLKTFEKEDAEQSHHFLILSSNKYSGYSNDKTTIIDINTSSDIIWRKIEQFFYDIEDEQTINKLFFTEDDKKNKHLTDRIPEIYRTSYKQAKETKVLEIIEVLANDLLNIANTGNMKNLISFSKKLIENVKQFNIENIDKQLNILDKAFKVFFNSTK